MNTESIMKFIEEEPYGTRTRNFYSKNLDQYMEAFLTKDTNRKIKTARKT